MLCLWCEAKVEPSPPQRKLPLCEPSAPFSSWTPPVSEQCSAADRRSCTSGLESSDPPSNSSSQLTALQVENIVCIEPSKSLCPWFHHCSPPQSCASAQRTLPVGSRDAAKSTGLYGFAVAMPCRKSRQNRVGPWLEKCQKMKDKDYDQHAVRFSEWVLEFIFRSIWCTFSLIYFLRILFISWTLIQFVLACV